MEDNSSDVFSYLTLLRYLDIFVYAVFKVLIVCSRSKTHDRPFRFVNRLTQSPSGAFRLFLTNLFSANGDGGIRTLDPLLARQVLSQLSYTPMGIIFRGFLTPVKKLPLYRLKWAFPPLLKSFHFMGLSGPFLLCWKASTLWA